MKSTRNYGIDLLRLVLMFMVCILHVLDQGGVLAACAVGSTSYRVYWLLETLAICAVDGFALISGYIASNRPQKYSRIVDMWFQVWFYSFILSLVFTLFGLDGDWSLSNLLKRIFPVTFNQYWYFTAYFALFFAAPMLNPFLFAAEESTAKKALLLLVILFSLLGTAADPFYAQYGYSPLWVIVLYCIGVMANRIRLFASRSTAELVLIWLFSNLISWGLQAFVGIGRLTVYSAPTTLVSALTLVILFSRMTLSGAWIRKAAPLSFGIYLFQLSPVLWSEVIHNGFSFISGMPLVPGIFCVLLGAALIFFAGLLAEFLRSRLAQLIRLPLLSQKIVSAADHLLAKCAVLLK